MIIYEVLYVFEFKQCNKLQISRGKLDLCITSHATAIPLWGNLKYFLDNISEKQNHATLHTLFLSQFRKSPKTSSKKLIYVPLRESESFNYLNIFSTFRSITSRTIQNWLWEERGILWWPTSTVKDNLAPGSWLTSPERGPLLRSGSGCPTWPRSSRSLPSLMNKLPVSFFLVKIQFRSLKVR